jgi:hypothetical protein
MPCRCDDMGPSREEIELRDIAFRLACDYCKHLEKLGSAVPKWAEKWLERHLEQDAERREQEDQEQRRTRLRKKAMAKLTNEEREALGVYR